MTAGMPLQEGVARLSRIALRQLNTGQGPRDVLAFLGSEGTAQLYGSEAAAVVVALIGTPR